MGPRFRGTFENRHSGARHPISGLPEIGRYCCPSRQSRLGWREPGIHSHNTIILACLYDEATGVMNSGRLASLGPGMTRSYATLFRAA